jgi:3-oxoacyl-[acyl-carrier-protein] synthase-3
LLRILHLEPADVNAVISVTQTPDYRMPGNAHVLHRRLGLPKKAPALDVGMGCSGYVYGLWLAAMTAASGGCRVLLAAGDTLSKAVNAADRTLAPLCGDAGSATVIEFSPSAGEMRFILRADGSGLEKMHIPAGGFRTPSTAETRTAVLHEDGCMRSQEDVHMDGFGIFDFTVTEQPALLADILSFAGKSVEDIDYFILHQANRYIVETIAEAAGIPSEKIPADLFSRFGNQNAASIPGVLCGALGEKLAGKKIQTVMQGFGVGLSWGACQLELDCILCPRPLRRQAETDASAGR